MKTRLSLSPILFNCILSLFSHWYKNKNVLIIDSTSVHQRVANIFYLYTGTKVYRNYYQFNITIIKLIKGNGTVTRCPIVIRFVQSSIEQHFVWNEEDLAVADFRKHDYKVNRNVTLTFLFVSLGGVARLDARDN